MRILYLLIFLLSVSGCNLISKDKDEETSKKMNTLFLLNFPVDQDSQLFKYIPGTVGIKPTVNQFDELVIHQKSSKPKIILVHGYNPLETNSDPATGKAKKVSNILFYAWEYTLKSMVNGNLANVTDKYDIYAFTYRTASSAWISGRSLITALNTYFEPSDKVIILAHSMGGVVSRYAVYDENNTKDVIDYVVTLATPYYGSPLTSSAYLNTVGGKNIFLSAIGSIGFNLVDDDGGKSIQHTNNGNGQTTVVGAENKELDSLNSLTSKDSKFYPYAGKFTSCSNAKNTYYLYSKRCEFFRDRTPSFPDNDGSVPLNSQIMAGKRGNDAVIKLDFDHQLMSFTFDHSKDEQTVRDFFVEVITRINTLP